MSDYTTASNKDSSTIKVDCVCPECEHSFEKEVDIKIESEVTVTAN